MIIGIHGKARSGKDTVAAMIQNQTQLPIRAFADPLKRASMELFGLTKDQAFGLKGYNREIPHPDWGISVREMQQKLGTECMRDVFGPDFWLRTMGYRIAALPGVIISDVRFQNEADWIKEKGGKIVEVRRAPHAEELHGDQAYHLSEKGVEGADFVIDNNQGISELGKKVVKLLEEI